jgi:intracellular sulfur oxidation DsrE/DsrF family protein
MTTSLKPAAKAGDVKALEALMNKAFQAKGVTVRITSTGPALKILLQCSSPPDRQLAKLVKQGSRILILRDLSR